MILTLTILGMAAITFAVKAGLFIAGDRIVFPDLLRRALGFVPVTVLTAIVVPMMLAPKDGVLDLSLGNPQLIAGIVAIATAALVRHQLVTIAVGLVVFFLLQAVLAG